MMHSEPEAKRAADEGGLAAGYVSMTDSEAVAVAKKHFAVEGKVARVATEKDDTFRLTTIDGQRFILKVANPSEQAEEIRFQVELLRHVAEIDPRIPVPRAIVDIFGHACVEIVDLAGQCRHLRLMTYLDGTLLDSTHSSATERERVGETLGRLRSATAGFAHPADSRVLAWDVRHLLKMEHLLEHVEEQQKRKHLAAGLDRFAGLMSRIESLRSQVLHNDFSKSNIVVDHARDEFVTGIIDFGDAVRTAVAIDVSTALLNQLPRKAGADPCVDLFADGRDVLRGYLRVTDLTAEELALIPHLVMGRVVVRALLTLWRARLFPENSTYILRNTEQGWAQLDWFLRRPVDQVSATLLGVPV
jgi:Ser/Thr protein kinase RdoA (MazF antagonist)